MSASRYLRALGLALPIQSTIDHRAVLDLLKINADLGLPDDAATKALFEFLGKALTK